MNSAVFGKTKKDVSKKDILNLSQQKGEESIWCHNQIIIQQCFPQEVY